MVRFDADTYAIFRCVKRKVTNLPFKEAIFEDALDTLADDWLLSRCASFNSLRYSSPADIPKGGVTRPGLCRQCECISTHDSVT